MGTQKNRLNKMILLSTQNTFKLMGKEINAILGAQAILIWTYACVLIILNVILNEILQALIYSRPLVKCV